MTGLHTGAGRPEFDSWLAHLRRDRRGLPVPYINMWGTEDIGRMHLAHDRHIGQRAVFPDDTGQNLPDFTRQHMGRQRECMAAGLCQVCARPVPWSRRNLIVSGISVDWIPLHGRHVPVVTEPWLDDRCTHIATHWCPALIRRHKLDDLHVVPIRSQRDIQLIVSTGWIDGPLEAETKASPAAMWCKAALTNTLILPADLSTRR